MMPLNGHGSYLVRESKSNPDIYALSVRDRKNVKHYRIRRSGNGEFTINKRITFVTISDLIAHHKKQADGLCVNLILPCVISEKSRTMTLSEYTLNNEWEIDRSQIRLIKILTDGEFSKVWEGLWNEITPIAVKNRKPQTMTVHNFWHTAALMMKISHQNIIQVYGMCTKEEPMYIITELMKHGSLLEYLLGIGKSTQLPQLIEMASQVAEGMAYLEEMNCVHRKLAARNILVGENLICKVASFEMARVIDEDMIYICEALSQAEVAAKWTAPEATQPYNRFSIKSDVWSFGILLYEIITYGSFPYPGMTNDQVLEQVKQGYRMPQRSRCSDKLYNIMLNCWREEPENRPTFEALKWQLKDFFY